MENKKNKTNPSPTLVVTPTAAESHKHRVITWKMSGNPVKPLQNPALSVPISRDIAILSL